MVTNGSLRVKKSRAGVMVTTLSLISKLKAELQTATFLTNKEKKTETRFYQRHLFGRPVFSTHVTGCNSLITQCLGSKILSKLRLT